MTRWICILTLTFLVSSIKGHNPFWVHMDKVLIRKVTHLDKNNPKEIEAFFKSRSVENNPLHTTEDLGFGWKIWTSSVGGGYVSIRVNFVYYNDSIVSYFLEPQLPEERSLKGRYKRWYTPFFLAKKMKYLQLNIRRWCIISN
ncbi:MAG: hypothetical protein IPG08_10300 [Sphingobacteriaceae bacterium]|nr:hypothetical protein [Sphingobacteriaceae bacterium]